MHLHLERSPAVPARHDASELIDRARHGDHGAFEALYHENVGRVHALCLRFAGNVTRAEELTQDVFIRAWEQLGAFRGESALASWLHRIAVNVWLGALRAEGRSLARITSFDAIPEDGGAASLPIPGADIDLERAIAMLPPKTRAVFVLHDIEGYQHQEIALMMGTAVGTSKAQLFRARRLLREALDR